MRLSVPHPSGPIVPNDSTGAIAVHSFYDTTTHLPFIGSNNIPAEFQGIVIEEEIVGRALAWDLKNKDEVCLL